MSLSDTFEENDVCQLVCNFCQFFLKNSIQIDQHNFLVFLMT